MVSLQFARRSYQKVSTVDSATWEVFSAQRSLRELLESAYPLSDPRGRQQGIVGSQSRLDVVAPAPRSAGGGLFRYRIDTRTHGDHTDLVVRWVAELDTQGFERGKVLEEVLVERIAGARWDYCCSRALSSEVTPWEPTWNESSMPRRMRFRVNFLDGDARTWPDLIVAPRVDSDANCVFDVVAQACRGGV
jgi:general secretion pathway protein J